MENNRLLFRAVVEADYYDNDGNDKTVKLLLNNVAVYSPTTVGVTDEILVNAIRNTNLNAEERNSVYSYFKTNNECGDSEWFVLQAETIEQCTGLKDKNGRLIYENDIIKITEGVLPVDPKYVDCLFKTIWADIGFCLETLNGKDGLDFCECWEYEVVGNLHENPELLVVKETAKETVYKEPEIRDGWFVYTAGQNPLCCYWYCTLCSFDLKDKDGYACTVSVEGCTTFSQAVEQANKLVEELENVSKN